MDRLKRLQDLESDLMAAEAEIERLQAWKDEHSRTEGGECPYCEIERLLLTISWTRATLEEIAKGCDLSNEAQAIAREALTRG
jgi:hypothetical protein